MKTKQTMNTKQIWYSPKTESHQGLIVAEGTGDNIAVAYDKDNAPLLAAAPELLEALKAMLVEFQSRIALIESCDLTEGETTAMDKAEQAIQKAEGL